jgi:hypothetical protein
LPKKVYIQEIKVFNRMSQSEQNRIDGVTVWIGTSLGGGKYDGAKKVGTIQCEMDKSPYIFSDIGMTGSSVQLKGGMKRLQIAEVEVYGSG